ncbi:hypothetical protein G7Y89_g15184 [Cudoniella acicularis]|uniref:Zn(2)-C6 fungal-type domain-containing protein n=1 Tax=Cudoniella acicularis TaxID=354080 RepID=A0A8H4QSU3_9HELO|nr:hypothetical protein G7Y89_g15184 [Cudoniella acicularis]
MVAVETTRDSSSSHALALRSAGAGTPKNLGSVSVNGREKKRVKVKAPKEARPSCLRCVRFGATCDGYPKPPSTASIVTTRKLVPKTKAALVHLQQPTRSPFQEESEYRYFRYYCEEVATRIQGTLKTELWNQLIPQAGETQPYIRHAIIAIGALSRSRKLIGWKKEPSLSDPHNRYALVQYCKALKGMRESIKDSVDDGRNALLACLLVFCFESLQGHQAVASAHAANLVNLFLRWRWSSIDNIKFNSSSPRVSAESIRVEECLHDAFGGLDIQALLFVDKRPTSMHYRLKEEMNTAIDLMMPTSEFTSLKDCRNVWQIMMRRNLHFINAARSAATFDFPDSENTTVDGEEEDPIAIMVPGNNAWNTPKNGLSAHIPSSLIVERDTYIKDIQRYHEASEKLFATYSSTPPLLATENEKREYLQTQMLKIHAAFNILLLARTFFPPESVYDDLLPTFRSVVDLSSQVAPFLSGTCEEGTLFRFNIGIIAPLAQTSMVCRDASTRARAIDILFSLPGYREGIWDSLAVAHISQWIRDIEVEWADERGFVPGDRRASLAGVEIKLQERTAKVTAIQGQGPGMKGMLERSSVLKW